MKLILAIIIALASITFAGEAMPSYDDILNQTSTNIEIPKFEIEAPKATGTLQGIPDTKTELTTEDIIETVRANQGRLTYTYKAYILKKDDTINRLFDLTLTIAPNGTITKAIVKGPKNKEFNQEITNIISTWTFEKTTKSKTVTLRNLDFMFRNELSME